METLKAQHATLVKSVQNISYIDPTQSIHASPLPFTAEEEEQFHGSASGSGSARFSTPLSRLSKRTSIATTVSGSINEWFDASDGVNDGAQEFVMDVQASPDGTEQPSRLLSNDSRSSLGQDNSSVDTDIEQEGEAPLRFPSEDSQTDPTDGTLQVMRRSQLPAPPVGDEGSLFAMLKKNVGKVSVSSDNTLF